MRYYQKIIKRLLDLLLSLMALLVLQPLFIFISLLIIIDSGRPVLFIQKRVGLKGSTFCCYKFRTMKVGTPMDFNPDGSTKVVEKDLRVTKIGRLLRKYSLDELPQLLNVFLGQMSMVGPRPDLPIHWENYNETQRQRYTVKPGITGLAQVMGRNSLTVEEKIIYDLYYIKKYSLLLDIKIILKTVGVILDSSNVYNQEKIRGI